MPFSKLDIPFGAVDTKTDERMLPNGALLLAENCSSQTVGVYKKRYGYESLTSPGTLPLRLASRGNQLLAVLVGGQLVAFDGVATWRSLGAGPVGIPLRLPDAQTSQTNITLDQSNDVTRGTRCTANGVTVHAYIRAGTVWVRLVDSAGAIIAETFTDSGTFHFIHAAAAGNIVVVFYTTSTQTVRAVKVDTAARTIAAAVSYQTGAAVNATTPWLDVCPLNSTDVIVAWYSATPDVRVARFDTSTMTTAAGPTVMSAEVVDSGLAVFGTTGEFGAILYHGTAAGGMRAACFNVSTTAQTVAPFMVEGVTSPAGINCGMTRVDATHIMAVWDRAASGISKQYVKWSQISSAGVVTAVGTLPNCALASKPFDGQTSLLSLNVWAPYSTQFTYFTVHVSTAAGGPVCYPTAMHAYRSAYRSAQVLGQLTDVDVLSATATDKYAFSAPIGYKFLSTSSERAGWATFGLEYRSGNLFRYVEALGDTFFAAGLVAKTDGFITSEVNFPLFPEITQATPGAVASGGMDDGQYSYVAIFEASDGSGNTDRSTPAIPISATTAAGAGLGKVTLTIDQLSITRIGQTSLVGGNISIFRTQVADTTYRFIGTVAITPGLTSSTYVDQAHDSTIATNRLLYTNDSDAGTILEREPPPAALYLTLHKDRMWGISSADRKVLFYSGKLVPGEAPWFSSLQQVRIDVGGDCVALASMDDKLIVFKADRVFKIYGDGPNELGQNNDLTEPALVTSDAGCVESRSVVMTDRGLLFLSDKGLYGLSRGEELSYVGESMDLYWKNYAIVAVSMIPDQQEVRFELFGGGDVVDALSGSVISSQKAVFNYATGQWTTHRNYLNRLSLDAIVVNGRYHWVDSSSNLHRETPPNVEDPSGTFIRMLIRTGWVKPSGFQGWNRVQRAMLLNKRVSGHALTMFCENDYVATTTSTKTWSNADLVTLPREQVALHLDQQKGESYRFTIYDAADAGSSGADMFGLQLRAKEIRGTFEKTLIAAAKG